MNKLSPLFSIVIPVRTTTPYLRETLSNLKDQSDTSFEILVITDKISKNPNPAFKRNLGAKMAKGKYLAFLDDDSYPQINWLKNAQKQLRNDLVAAVCGPCLTPPDDSLSQKASGLVWSSFLGSGGAGSYRNSIQSPRFVNDFPSVNLIIKKTDFFKIGGFQTDHWPGEDTLLCKDIVQKLRKKILYHPSLVVYHHRRPTLIPHLQQIKRYALHRGFFAKKYPENSRKIGYFVPSIFLIYILILIPLNLIVGSLFLLNLPLFLYLILLIASFVIFVSSKNSLISSLLALVTIPITHLYYGFLFLVGLISPQLPFQPHKVNHKTNTYLGG